VSDREAREKAAIDKFLGKEGLDPEADYRELAGQIDRLIEELDLTSLLQQFDQLERGADKIAELKEEYAKWLGG
ncbi:MAG: hypothetical protein KDB07_04850, partial [Planctomycetes bacterium]|nr:hypothetical protein [Planctomycetota bacterium]